MSLSKERLEQLNHFIQCNKTQIGVIYNLEESCSDQDNGIRFSMVASAGIPHQRKSLASRMDESPRTLKEVIDHKDDTFQEELFTLIDRKKKSDVDVYTRAHIDRRLFSKIRSDKEFHPSKKTAICLCFGLELNLDESLDLLFKAGYSLSFSSDFDLIVRFFLKEKIYDLMEVNGALFEYHQDLLF